MAGLVPAMTSAPISRFIMSNSQAPSLFHRSRVPDAAQRFFSGAPQSRDHTGIEQDDGPRISSAPYRTMRSLSAGRALRGPVGIAGSRCAASGARVSIPAARPVPELCHRHVPRREEGAGNAGCAARTHSLACKQKKTRKQKSPQVKPHHATFPARMVLTVSFVLSPVSMTSESPVACGSSLAGLTPAKGRLAPAFRSSNAIAEPYCELRKAKGASRLKIPVPLSI
jgi:hypothetical protein